MDRRSEFLQLLRPKQHTEQPRDKHYVIKVRGSGCTALLVLNLCARWVWSASTPRLLYIANSVAGNQWRWLGPGVSPDVMGKTKSPTSGNPIASSVTAVLALAGCTVQDDPTTSAMHRYRTKSAWNSPGVNYSFYLNFSTG